MEPLGRGPNSHIALRYSIARVPEKLLGALVSAAFAIEETNRTTVTLRKAFLTMVSTRYLHKENSLQPFPLCIMGILSVSKHILPVSETYLVLKHATKIVSHTLHIRRAVASITSQHHYMMNLIFVPNTDTGAKHRTPKVRFLYCSDFSIFKFCFYYHGR
jgi:hypothetical protein